MGIKMYISQISPTNENYQPRNRGITSIGVKPETDETDGSSVIDGVLVPENEGFVVKNGIVYSLNADSIAGDPEVSIQFIKRVGFPTNGKTIDKNA